MKFQVHIGLSCPAFTSVQIISGGTAYASVTLESSGEVSRCDIGKSLYGRERAVVRLARIAAKSESVRLASQTRVFAMQKARANA